MRETELKRLIDLAHEALSHDKIGEAEEALRGVLAVRPDLAEAKMLLAVACYRRGRMKEVIKVLQSIPESRTNSAAACVLGEAATRIGDVALARRSFEASLRMSPTNFRAMCGLAELELASKDTLEAARSHVEAALAIDPQYAVAHQQLGRLHWKSGQLLDAQRELERAMNLDPSNYWSLAYLAQLLSVIDKADGAVPLLRKATELVPENAALWAWLAEAHFRRSDWQQSREAYEESLRLDPFEAQSNLGYALVLTELGQQPEAKIYLEKVLNLDPTERQRQIAEDALAE